MFLQFYCDGTVLLVASTSGLALYNLCSGQCIRRDASYGPLALAAWEEKTDTLVTVCGKSTLDLTVTEERNCAQPDALADVNAQFGMFLHTTPEHCVVVTYKFLSDERKYTSITTEGPVTHVAMNPLHLMLLVNGSLSLYSRESLDPVASFEPSGPKSAPGEVIPVSLSAVRLWGCSEKLEDFLFHKHEVPQGDGEVSFVAVSSRPMPKKGEKLSLTTESPSEKIRRDVLIACVPCKAFQPLTTFMISSVHHEGVATLSFSPTAECIATTSKRGTVIKLFSVPEGAPMRTFRRSHSSAEVRAFLFSTNGALLTALTSSSTLHVFSTQTGLATSKRASETEQRSVARVKLPASLLSSSSMPQHDSVISFMNSFYSSVDELPMLSLVIPSREALMVHRFTKQGENYECDKEDTLTIEL